VRRILKAVAWTFGFLVVALIVAAVATIRSGNAKLYPPPNGEPRIEVFVVANFHHSGIVLPRQALADAAQRLSLPALNAVTKHFAGYERLEFGWGDEAFYTRVPTTAEVTVMLALRALFRPGNASVLHVVGLALPPQESYPNADLVALTLGGDGFARLATMLDATFARSGRDGGVEALGKGLYGPSLFYRAIGTFNLLRVCNHWTADLLDAAGVPTAPVLATWPQGLLWDLSRRAGAIKLAPTPATTPVKQGNVGPWPISSSRSPAGITIARAR
jgi:uncharacterized protein (TIGR02117 family)